MNDGGNELDTEVVEKEKLLAVQTKITRDEYMRLRITAIERHITMAEFIRMAIKDALDKIKP